MPHPTTPAPDAPPLWELGDLLTVATGRVFYGPDSTLPDLVEHLTGHAVALTTGLPDGCDVARDHVRAHLPFWPEIAPQLPDDDDASAFDAAGFLRRARLRWGARHPVPPMPDQSWTPPHPLAPLARIGSGLPGYRPSAPPVIGPRYDYLRKTAARLHELGHQHQVLAHDLMLVAHSAETGPWRLGEAVPGLALANYVHSLEQAGHQWLQ